jgi:hypothetical protein
MILAPVAFFSIIGLGAAAQVELAFWLAKHGIYTNMCPSPATAARREAEAAASAAADRKALRSKCLAGWIESAKQEALELEIKRQQATNDYARWEAENTLCWALATELFYTDVQTGKIIDDGFIEVDNRKHKLRDSLLWDRFHRRYIELPKMAELQRRISEASARALPPYEQRIVDQNINDVVLALMALGIYQTEAQEEARATQAMLGPDASVEQLVRVCLSSVWR